MEAKFTTLRRLFFLAATGFLPLLLALVLRGEGVRVFFAGMAVVLMIPALIYLVVFTLLLSAYAPGSARHGSVRRAGYNGVSGLAAFGVQ